MLSTATLYYITFVGYGCFMDVSLILTANSSLRGDLIIRVMLIVPTIQEIVHCRIHGMHGRQVRGTRHHGNTMIRVHFKKKRPDGIFDNPKPNTRAATKGTNAPHLFFGSVPSLSYLPASLAQQILFVGKAVRTLRRGTSSFACRWLQDKNAKSQIFNYASLTRRWHRLKRLWRL